MHKLLVVEDQPAAREGMLRMVETVFPGQFHLLWAENGQAGYEMAMREQPDILLTDVIMPVMNGLEMVEQMPEGARPPVIIMSAFEEFHYARKALALGAVDYLIKPVTEKDLYGAVTKALSSMQIEAAPGYSDRILYDYVSGAEMAFDGQLVPKYRQLAQMRRPWWAVALWEVRLAAGQRLAERQQAMEAALRSPDWDMVCFHNYETRVAAVVNLQEDDMQRVGDAWRRALGHLQGMWMGISQAQDSPRQLQTLFRQAEHALDRAMVSTEGMALFGGSGQAETGGVVTHSICAGLVSAIHQGQQKEAERMLDKVFGDVSHMCTSFRMARTEYEKLMVYVDMHTGFLQKPEHLLAQGIEGLAAAKTPLAAKAQVTAYVGQLLAIPRGEGGGALDMQRVCDFVEKNYARDINASTLANFANMSYSYFCSTFSRQMGMTTSEYINEVRLSHAQAMLSGQALKITEVAHRCGFSDYRYFSKQFKKKFGVSPAIYKNRG